MSGRVAQAAGAPLACVNSLHRLLFERREVLALFDRVNAPADLAFHGSAECRAARGRTASIYAHE
jgi:hypothetical protein